MIKHTNMACDSLHFHPKTLPNKSHMFPLLPNLQSSLSPMQNPCYGYQAWNIYIQSYDVVHQTWNKLRVRCFVLTHCQGIHKERYEKGGLILIDSSEILVVLFMIENEIKISSEFNCISSSQISTLFIDTSPLPSWRRVQKIK